ncbi:MAG: exo-alpha-sialidase [Chloroflexi bacterium]|nr:MAG: exo-alpha-sialidase [Chloroflexota bacterium]
METAVAQSQTRWSPQDRIPFYDDLILEPPHLIADSSGVVHTFNAQTIDEDETAAIMYRRWTVEQGWNTPVDIILPPENEIRARNMQLGVILDQNNIVHLVFTAGNQRGARILYTKAPLYDVNNAWAWSELQIIGTHVWLSPPQVTMVSNGTGDLYVAFSSDRDGTGLYMVQSNNNGESWSPMESIFLTYTNDLWPSALTMYLDSQENVHALWGMAGLNGLSVAVFYSQLERDQSSWREPMELARVTGFQADTPAIIEYDGELTVTFHNDVPTTSWIRKSSDGGFTWTDPVRFAAGFVGSNGAVDYVVDSSNTLHAFWGNRTGSPIIHGMWHRIWLGDRWGEVEAVVSGPQVVDEIGGDGFDPKFARAVISRGNILLLTWTTDGFAGENGAWYSYTILDAPQLPAVPIPVPSEAPLTTATPVPVDQTPTPNPFLLESTNNEAGNAEFSPGRPLVYGVVPVLILIGLIVIANRIYYFTRS